MGSLTPTHSGRGVQPSGGAAQPQQPHHRHHHHHHHQHRKVHRRPSAWDLFDHSAGWLLVVLRLLALLAASGALLVLVVRAWSGLPDISSAHSARAALINHGLPTATTYSGSTLMGAATADSAADELQQGHPLPRLRMKNAGAIDGAGMGTGTGGLIVAGSGAARPESQRPGTDGAKRRWPVAATSGVVLGLQSGGVPARRGGGDGGDGGDSGGAAAEEPSSAEGSSSKTLGFEVCHGFAAQRLSIAHGLLIARQLGRTPVLPTLMQYGVQMAPFETIYDITALHHALGQHGMAALTQQQHLARGGGAQKDSVTVQLGSSTLITDVPAFFRDHQDAPHISIDCPLHRLAPAVVRAGRGFMWSALTALQPAAKLSTHVARALRRVGDGAFNFLHLRIERDWRTYCEGCVRVSLTCCG
jgi:hypothetical protein